MNDLPLTAVLLIYPDGYIDQCLVTEEENHICYLRNLRETSPRFAKITKDCDFEPHNHILIDKVLNKNGIIALYNFDTELIAQNHDYVLDFTPAYKIFLPHSYGSIKQIKLLEDFIEKYPSSNKSYFGFIKDNVKGPKEENYDEISLENLKNKLKEAKSQITLAYLAFILIYPDGYVDKMMIDKREYHVDYYKELRTKSQRFSQICGKCNYNDGVHNDFDVALTKAGIVVLYNYNLKDIADDYQIVSDKWLPGFFNFLPKKLGSLEQLELLKTFHTIYPKENITYNIGPKDRVVNFQYFDDKTYDEITEFIIEEEKRLNELEENKERRNINGKF